MNEIFSLSSTVITLALVPTLAMIEDLKEGNVLWSPAQLSSMAAQTFRDAVSVLGEIRNYTTEQLAALRDKATEVHVHTYIPTHTQTHCHLECTVKDRSVFI